LSAAAELGGHARLSDACRRLVESPPIDASKGGYIAEGYDARSMRCARSSDGRRAIAALEARYRDATGVASLKIRTMRCSAIISRSARGTPTG
jgi:DNA mismatch repair protein MutS